MKIDLDIVDSFNINISSIFKELDNPRDNDGDNKIRFFTLIVI